MEKQGLFVPYFVDISASECCSTSRHKNFMLVSDIVLQIEEVQPGSSWRGYLLP